MVYLHIIQTLCDVIVTICYYNQYDGHYHYMNNHYFHYHSWLSLSLLLQYYNHNIITISWIKKYCSTRWIYQCHPMSITGTCGRPWKPMAAKMADTWGRDEARATGWDRCMVCRENVQKCGIILSCSLAMSCQYCVKMCVKPCVQNPGVLHLGSYCSNGSYLLMAGMVAVSIYGYILRHDALIFFAVYVCIN